MMILRLPIFPLLATLISGYNISNWAPANYPPSASAFLVVEYQDGFPEDGSTTGIEPQWQGPPNVSLEWTVLQNQSYMLVMIDASIPLSIVPSKSGQKVTANDVVPGIEPNRTTYLQWMQTNLNQTPFGNFSSSTNPYASYVAADPLPTEDATPHTIIYYLFNQPQNFTIPPADIIYGSNDSARYNFSVMAIVEEVGRPIAAHYNLVDASARDPPSITSSVSVATATSRSGTAATPMAGTGGLGAGLAIAAAVLLLP